MPKPRTRPSPVSNVSEIARRQARLAELEKLVFAALRTANVKVWDIGIWLAEIEDQKLHAGRGHRSFNRYVFAVFGFDRNTAWVYRVVSRYPREAVEECGPNHVFWAAQYFDLTPEEERPEDMLTYRFPVLVKGTVVPKRLKECTVRELKALVKRTRSDRTIEILPADLRRFVQTMRSLMAGAGDFAFDVTSQRSRVRIRTAVDLDDFERFCLAGLKALRGLSYRPPPDVPAELAAPEPTPPAGEREPAPELAPRPTLGPPPAPAAAPRPPLPGGAPSVEAWPPRPSVRPHDLARTAAPRPAVVRSDLPPHLAPRGYALYDARASARRPAASSGTRRGARRRF